MQPQLRAMLLSAPGVADADRDDSVFAQLQRMLAHLALTKHVWYAPSGFWRAFKDYDGQPIDVREHQDAYEFFTRLQVRGLCGAILGTVAHDLLCLGFGSPTPSTLL
jgi:hypothetical protein